MRAFKASSTVNLTGTPLSITESGSSSIATKGTTVLSSRCTHKRGCRDFGIASTGVLVLSEEVAGVWTPLLVFVVMLKLLLYPELGVYLKLMAIDDVLKGEDVVC